ncbi:MAG: 50S ribosomal protein L23, partial [Culicoidibacterales bacterium]
ERKFVFEVASDANKTAIKQAVEILFDGVKVANVNTINSKPKARRVGKHLGKTAAIRKAIITLTADSKEIELF